MRNLFRKTLVCAALVALQLAIPVKYLHAGPVWDWLLGRPILTYPAQPAVVASPAPVLAPASAVATVGYPTTVRYGVTDATSFPLTTRYAPTAAPAYAAPAYAAPAYAAPAYAAPAYAAPAYAAPMTANYAAAPVAGCNTCPAPAATTSYLPAVAVQGPPYSIPTVVGYAPAYRSSWYRVPVTYYRPVTAYTGVAAQPVTVMQPCNTQTYQVQRTPFLFHRPWLPARTATPYATAYAPVVTQPAYPAVMATAPMTAGAACPCPNAATVAPSLNTPYYAPSTAMPATTYPSVTTPQTSSTHIPSSSDTTPEASSSTPADQAPALQQIESAQPVNPNSASTAQPGATSSASSHRISPNGASSVYQVKPIPDPEATQRTNEPRVVAPPLLTPRERTAAAQPVTKSTAVTRAVYKTSVPAPAAAKPAPAKQQLWSDAGWQTAGR